MNVNTFLSLTKSAGRKIILGTQTPKDFQILQAGMKGLRDFFLAYSKNFSSQLGTTQKKIITEILSACQESVTRDSFQKVSSKLKEFSAQGINIIVRHPEPLLSSYNEQPGRNLKLRGVLQVWNFDKFLGQFLEAYDSVSVNFFCSDRKRTILFAELCHHYLEKHAPQARLSSPQGVSILSAKSTVQDMKTRYPEYKAQIEDGKPRNMRKMKITREYFKRWIAESPLAQTTANEVNALLNSFQNNTLNIYFTHENIIGAYLYHKLNVPAEKTLIGFAHHVTVSPGNVYVRF